jgi:hypothetical protein
LFSADSAVLLFDALVVVVLIAAVWTGCGILRDAAAAWSEVLR